MSPTPDQLRALLDRIFADAIVEPNERAELFQYSSALPREETLAVFRRFISDKWGEAIADDVITPQERALLSRIVSELSIQLLDLPEQMQHALRDHL